MVEVKKRLQDLIDSKRLPHAMAFTGGSQDWRNRMAEWLAEALGCDVNRGGLLKIESDGVQIKLEQARGILDFLSLSRLSEHRMVVIDEAQLLNAQTANALLKIVEEPPENSFFVLLTPSFSMLMPTLRSRTQIFRLPFATAKADAEVDDPEIVQVVEQALHGLSHRQRPAWNALIDYVKDKNTALKVARICQRTLRNATVQKPDEPMLLKWWRSAFQLEQDILANLDRTLLFENFYYQATR